jgi:hypothetical protein
MSSGGKAADFRASLTTSLVAAAMPPPKRNSPYQPLKEVTMLNQLLIAALILAASPPPVTEIPIGRFSAQDLSGWSDKNFKGKKTSYTLEDGVLKAQSAKGASGKIKKVSIDTRKYPKLSWSWRIDHVLKGENIKLKSGDDFAARVYVVFPRTFFWRMRAINYVWAAKMPKGSEAPSPYTANSVAVALESGEDKAGKWVLEERNIYEDYKRIFGEEPPLLGGVAIMTDTDDTQDEATAWYGDLTLHAP